MAQRLLVDSREPDFIKEKLADVSDIVFMEEGDYVWDSPLTGSWAIERKDVSDLVSSVFSGRLQDQLRRCSEIFKHVVLLIEGYYTQAANGEVQIKIKGGGVIHRKVQWAVLEDVLDELQMMGVFRVHTTSLLDTTHRIRRLMSISDTTTHSLMEMRPSKLEFGTKADDRLLIVSAFPGIGMKLAQVLLNQFGNVAVITSLFQNKHTILNDIPGLGPKKIEAVYKVLME
jgi:DNA excision repair protein ERCC-4